MCGIAGAYGTEWRHPYQALELIGHRGPDGHAITYLPNGYLAHARLAIVDVEGGRQPITGVAQSQWLICNGEIYNHRELRERYASYPYLTHSDSEDILAVYAQHRDSATAQLEGMYAFALVDEDGLFLARDPLGIKPLYYGSDGATLYFASEIKAVQDLVEQVEEFPAGHWYSSKRGFVQYYDLQEVDQVSGREMHSRISPRDVNRQLRRAVHTHLMSDVPLGVFLSGGLDSSIIAALSSRRFLSCIPSQSAQQTARTWSMPGRWRGIWAQSITSICIPRKR